MNMISALAKTQTWQHIYDSKKPTLVSNSLDPKAQDVHLKTPFVLCQQHKHKASA